MRHKLSWQSTVLSSCLILPVACVAGSNGTSETTATGGVGGTGPDGVLGYQWCVQAASAAGRWEDPPFAGQNIWHPDTDTWLRGCVCYCPEDNSTMSNGVAGSLVGADLAWYNAQVSALRGLAKAACSSRQAELELAAGDVLEFDLAWTETCAEAVNDEDPFQTTECVKHEGECSTEIPVDGTAGQEQVDDSGSDGGGAFVYGLTDYDDAIDERADPTQIDTDFVRDLLDDLTVFEDDNIGVVLASSAQGYGFEFETLGAESLPVALGFQEGDVVLTVNGGSLASIADVTAAFESLHQEHDFEVTISRSGSSRTLDFELVDLTTYP